MSNLSIKDSPLHKFPNITYKDIIGKTVIFDIVGPEEVTIVGATPSYNYFKVFYPVSQHYNVLRTSLRSDIDFEDQGESYTIMEIFDNYITKDYKYLNSEIYQAIYEYQKYIHRYDITFISGSDERAIETAIKLTPSEYKLKYVSKLILVENAQEKHKFIYIVDE